MPGPVFYPTHDAGQPVIRPADVREALPAIGVGLFAGLGGFLFGYDTGVISGLLEMPQFGKQFGKYWDNVPQNPAGSPARPGYALSTSGRSLVVSILSVGTFFGALFAAPLGDFFGRRAALKVSIVVFALGVLIQAVGHSISVFALGRVCGESKEEETWMFASRADICVQQRVWVLAWSLSLCPCIKLKPHPVGVEEQ